MKIQAKIEGEKLNVEITRHNGTVAANVDGREYMLDVSEPEPNIYSFRNGGLVVEAFVSPGTIAGTSKVTINGHEFEIELIDPKRLRGSGVESDSTTGSAEIKTAMPGKVVRVLVESGTIVEKGDGVIIVEAMKMQNEMKSPKDGVVKEIRTTEGATVNAGDVLAIIE